MISFFSTNKKVFNISTKEIEKFNQNWITFKSNSDILYILFLQKNNKSLSTKSQETESFIVTPDKSLATTSGTLLNNITDKSTCTIHFNPPLFLC